MTVTQMLHSATLLQSEILAGQLLIQHAHRGLLCTKVYHFTMDMHAS